jgi:hypothetical protein
MSKICAATTTNSMASMVYERLCFKEKSTPCVSRWPVEMFCDAS